MASPTWPSSRPTTSRRATPAATRPSSAPTTACPGRSASTSTRSSSTSSWRPRPAPRSSTRPRASCGWRTREMAMRTERGRCLMNQACGARTEMVTPAQIKALVPQLDLTGGGRYPILGASYHVEAATARHDRVAWAYASGALAARRRPAPAHACHRVAPGRRAGRRRRDPRRADRCRRRPLRGRGSDHRHRRHGRRAPADPDPSVARLRDQRLRPGLRARSSPAPS